MEKNWKTCHVERQNTRPWIAFLKITCCQAPQDLKSRLEALLAEMFDLRELLSLVRACSIKRRKVKLMLKRKAQLYFKIALRKRWSEPCPLEQLEWHRISTPLHVQKQAILHRQGDRRLRCNHWSLKKCVLTKSCLLCKNAVFFAISFSLTKFQITYLHPTAFLLLFQDTNFSFWKSYLCFLP